ncbi:MAG TPA: L,D-transpeptidase family protein [Puia sp.]|nr:L,D-transpeptidase family protein [Puia sp.]
MEKRGYWIGLVLFCVAAGPVSGQQAGPVWCAEGEGAGALRKVLMRALDSAALNGLDSRDYLPGPLEWADSMVNSGKMEKQWPDWDRWFTEAGLAFCRDLYLGSGISKRISYDGISGQLTGRDEQYLAKGLARVSTGTALQEWINGLIPVDRDYSIMRDSLAMYRALGQSDRAGRLSWAMNIYRWMHHFRFDRMIVVNIPSADLRYYRGDSLSLCMKVVAGQPSKRTPRFAAWCNGIVLYPYWNVPRKIAVRELLPLFRKSPELIETMEMEVVDNRGRKIDPSEIKWASYTAANFPYEIRQTPGCYNALGVIKFNIVSPFDVYMHDTNLKKAFTSANRYFSHGCIRLERPIDLGRSLLENRLDTTYLLSCFRDQKPVPVAIGKPVPVFVVYQTVGVDPGGKLVWYKDIYQLGY